MSQKEKEIRYNIQELSTKVKMIGELKIELAKYKEENAALRKRLSEIEKTEQ